MRRPAVIAAVGMASFAVGMAGFLVLPAAAAMAATSAPGAAAAPSSVTSGHAGHAVRVAHAPSLASLPKIKAAPGAARRVIPKLRPGGKQPPAASSSAAPKISASADTIRRIGTASRVSLVQNFNGLSDLDSANVNGGHEITPPDQGLCAGLDTTMPGNPKAVWEAVNDVARETSPAGAPLRPDVSLATLFQDPFATGDPRCVYDPATQSFYFTEVGFPAGGPNASFTNTTVDVTVMNAHGVAAYQFDTSRGGQCLGDQPKTGFDNNALVVSTDEFCGADLSDFEGSLVLPISKSQLAAGAPTVNDAMLGPISQDGIPVTGADPAIGTGSGTEYLVNSVPFLADGSNNPVGHMLGLWTLSNDSSVTDGRGVPALTLTDLPSEPYAFPVADQSTGDGSTTVAADGSVITSEPAIDQGQDNLAGPVSVSQTPGGIMLSTALTAAVTPQGDSATRDGAAWFQIDPTAQRIVHQGYVSAKGAYLVYPAVQALKDGTAAMTFAITSSTINPSAAFTTLGSGTITTVATGAGPHLSFSDAPPNNRARWGDYSFAAPDPDGTGIWLATEYIPPAASQDPFDNWGTRMFEVTG